MSESTLPQGRALETFAAEHILHYTWRLSAEKTHRFLCPPNESEYSNEEWYPTTKGDEPLCADWDRFVPPLAREVGAAWLVVEKMKKDGLQLVLYSNPPGTYARPASAQFGRVGRGHIGRATGDSDAHAICLAALDALHNAGEVPDNG